MRYRPDIDGLRAVAVVFVLLYHLGFPFLTGGYIGVDVFFVISGYLVTRIIFSDLSAHRFTIAGFYERRIRRLFPAFIVMLLISMGMAVLILLPSDLDAFAKSSAATLSFASNFWFWKNSGYFDGASEYNPLLHMWSLSVEEQFYIAFPLLLILLFRFFPSRIRVVIFVLTVTSLGLSVGFLSSRPTAVFYLPVFRAWEMSIGCLLALSSPHKTKRFVHEIAALAGIIMILGAGFFFSDKTLFPGASALLPCVGAALLIRMGDGSFVGKVLGWRPFVAIGLISYSLYLWHWPLIVFARHWLARPFKIQESILLLLLSFGLGFLSWYFVEQPFRRPLNPVPQKRLFVIFSGIVLVVMAVCVFFHLRQGLPGRFDPLVVELDRERSPYVPFRECFSLDGEKLSEGRFCDVGSPGDSSEVLIWGDSHSLAVLPAIDSALNLTHLPGVYVGASACPPVFGVENRDKYHNNWHCLDVSRAVDRLVKENRSIKTVVLIAAWWSYSSDSSNYVLYGESGVKGNGPVLSRALEVTIDNLNKQGLEVVLVGQEPSPGWDLPYVMARDLATGRQSPMFSLAEYDSRMRPFRRILESVSSRQQFRLVELAPAFCTTGGDCLLQENGKPLYRDGGHLNVRGANRVIPLFYSTFQSLQLNAQF